MKNIKYRLLKRSMKNWNTSAKGREAANDPAMRNKERENAIDTIKAYILGIPDDVTPLLLIVDSLSQHHLWTPPPMDNKLYTDTRNTSLRTKPQ